MVELKAKEGELKATIQIIRKETGKVETYEVTGKVNHEEMEALLKEKQEGEQK